MCPHGSFSPRRSGVGAALALILLLLAAATAEPAPPADPLAALMVQSFQEPIPAPVLMLEAVDGRPLHLGDLKGNVVFLNFWATWCMPCRQEMPAMERLYRDYRERGLAVVAVNFKEPRDQVQAFLKQLHLTFPAVLDPGGTTALAFVVRGLPVTYLLARDGRVLWRAIGSRDWDGPDGRAYFERVLQPPRPSGP